MDICVVAGARPNFVKIAPILSALTGHPRLSATLLHTGQHYDAAMSDSFFRDLSMRAPDISLGVGSGSHAEQTARVMIAFERVLADRPFDLVLVVGDVNSTLACTVVAAKAGVHVAHVEAGLRSFDRQMPEEVNRIVTDALADLLFTTSADADENLLREGHPRDRIHLVGNTMIDTLMTHRDAVAAPQLLGNLGLTPRGYLVVTLHRPSNVDDPARLGAIVRALADSPLPVVFPIHPRTRAAAEAAGLALDDGQLRVVEPLGYLDFLALQANAALVVTDSGGIQEETTVLGVRCLTFRDNTERPVTISHGTNRLIGSDAALLLPQVVAALGEGSPPDRVPPLWDGHAATRIVSVLDAYSADWPRS